MTATIANRPRRVTGVILLVASTVALQPAHGQVRVVDAGRSQRCAGALESLRSGAAQFDSSLGALAECPAAAAAVLPDEWRRPNADTVVHLNKLMRASGRVRDRTVLDVLFGTLRDSSRSSEERTAALIAMGAYLDPSVSGFARRRTDNRNIEVQSGSQTHPHQVDGPRPLRPMDFATIFQLLHEIAAMRPTERTSSLVFSAKTIEFGLRRACSDPRRRGGVNFCPPP